MREIASSVIIGTLAHLPRRKIEETRIHFGLVVLTVHALAVGHLSDDDLRRFAADGYLVVPDVVEESLLGPADAEIDALIRDVPPHEDSDGPGQKAWFPPCDRLPRCEDVLRCSPALEIVEQLVAPNALDHAFDHIQVATTVPPWSHIPGGPHIDGHGPGQDPPASFTLLAGVLLTDQRDSASGNLWIWPGSHLDHQRLFQERGTKALRQTGGHSHAPRPAHCPSPRDPHHRPTRGPGGRTLPSRTQQGWQHGGIRTTDDLLPPWGSRSR